MVTFAVTFDLRVRLEVFHQTKCSWEASADRVCAQAVGADVPVEAAQAKGIAGEYCPFSAL
jgi:hypothetical protein